MLAKCITGSPALMPMTLCQICETDVDDCTVVQAFLVILQLGQMHVFDRLLENKSSFFLVIFFLFKIKSGTVIALNVAMHAGTVLP